MKGKRIISVIIALCMMLSLIPAPIAAAVDAQTSYEYLTSFKGLNALENMYVVDRGATFNNPLTGTSATVNFNTDPVLRNLGGTKRLLANNTLMNRNATCAVGKDGKECTPFAVMNLDKTVPWDVVVNAGNAVEITSNNIADGFMQKLFDVTGYGSKNSGWFLALRLNVPTKGRFSLEMDAYADASGVVPAIYFFKDDGSVVDIASGRTALRSNTPIGYHDFSGSEDSGYKAVADVDISEAGDYILMIFPDDTSAAKNANTISNRYQYMNLQGIKLTPIVREYENIEYLTSFKGLNALENMYVVDRGATFNNPLTGTSATVNFNTDPVLRNLGGTKRLLANNTLMNRNATCAVGKDGKECTPFAVMNLDKTVPWDVVVNAGNAVEITSNNIADGFMQKLFEVARYGNKNSGWFLALRLNVPTKGRFSLEMDAYADASGVVPAIYFFEDDGTVKDDASARTALRNNEPVGYHDFSGTEDSEYKAVADVNIASPGDYILIIFPDDTSAAKNTNILSDKYQYMNLQGIKLSPVTGEEEPTEDTALAEAFKVTETTASGYVESTVTGITEDATIEAEKNSDGTFSLTAPETKSDKKFLYWAKGMSTNKKIVSFSNKLGNYMPEEDGKNYLIAVYEGDVSDTAEYYNANGQRIATGTEPALPSMAGYGDATGWAKYGETNIYVAEYENKTQPDSVTVTVDGKANTVPYGTEITCTADSTKENFKCWTKSDINGKTEIVSANETYKFKAWETCTVTAIYEEHTYTGEKFKIIIDTFTAGNATAVMAEFVGFGSDVVEKGIMFEGKRIAMTKPGNQFTVIADESGTYEGYAIVGNQEDGYKLITDGEYKK